MQALTRKRGGSGLSVRRAWGSRLSSSRVGVHLNSWVDFGLHCLLPVLALLQSEGCQTSSQALSVTQLAVLVSYSLPCIYKDLKYKSKPAIQILSPSLLLVLGHRPEATQSFSGWLRGEGGGETGSLRSLASQKLPIPGGERAGQVPSSLQLQTRPHGSLYETPQFLVGYLHSTKPQIMEL